MADWRSIEDEKEKYQAYLCSPEWGQLRAMVHKRSDGRCERCRVFPIGAVHHLTYARKYAELPEDLAGYCEHCHAFTHGKSTFNPTALDPITCYFRSCMLGPSSQIPMPVEILYGRLSSRLVFLQGLSQQLEAMLGLASEIDYLPTLTDSPCYDHECAGVLYGLIWRLDDEMGFNFSHLPNDYGETFNPETYKELLKLFGLKTSPAPWMFAPANEGEEN